MKTFDDRKKSVEAYMNKIKRKRRKTAVIATSLTLVVTILALVLFVPYNTTPPSVRQYADSEYYGLIRQINALSCTPPKYKNNFQAMVGFFSNFGFKGASSGELYIDGALAGNAMMPEASPDGFNGEQYVEVTDNQVTGVTEADIFKRSDKYVYYLRGMELAVYSIAQADSQLMGQFSISWRDEYSYLDSVEMYLSADCSIVTVLAHGYTKTNGALTRIINLDVSDPDNIKEIGSVYFTGSYLSSRVVDGDILLTYNYSFRLNDVDFDDPTTFVPQYGTPGNMTCIPGSSIVCPEDASSARYTVVCKLDGESLDVLGTTALLGYSQELYVSADTIYATRSYSERNQESFDIKYRQTAMTEITGISYAGDTLEVVGTIAVEGSVKNQYSMDQYAGVLRVVTSTSLSYFKETVYGEFVSSTTSASERNVNLYCIDLENWEIAAEVIAFAPEGEDAQSVRFDGVNAYVCTAEVITLTDPVYFFDLSDLNNITWTDTGTIDGYSTSLIQLGDGYLLGVGYGAKRNLKIEVYEEYDGQVVSVSAYELDADFSEVYKSYLIDRENDLFGLEIFNWDTGKGEYVLLHFDGYKLHEIVRLPMNHGYSAMPFTRAFQTDGWLYILCFGFEGIYTQKLW